MQNKAREILGSILTEAFEMIGIKDSLNSASLQRIALLGWIHEFESDIALAEMPLYILYPTARKKAADQVKEVRIYNYASGVLIR